MILHITDHAVLRYLERVHGVDIGAVRERIGAAVDTAAGAAERLGVARYAVKRPEASYIVLNRTVVTVICPRHAVISLGTEKASDDV